MTGLSSLVAWPFPRWVDAWRERRQLEDRLRQATPVLIYQMGKVGSMSVHGSLARQYPGVVVHVHKLFPGHRRHEVRRLHRWVTIEKRPVHAISLTREPMARNISDFFQNFETLTGRSIADQRLTVEQLQQLFQETFDHLQCATWFDRQVRQTLGIDVYATPFPNEGFSVHEHGKNRLLVLRSEIDDGVKEHAIRGFLKLPNFRLESVHFSEAKDYGNLYQSFKRTAKFPRELLDKVYATRYVRHFYSSENLEEWRQRWLAA